MTYLLTGAKVFIEDSFTDTDLLVSNGNIVAVGISHSMDSDTIVIDCSRKVIIPGLVDVHVHLREPGFSYKGTIKTETMAAAKGGYTTVFAMPNLDPVPDSVEHLQKELDIIRRDAVIEVLPYGAITKGEKGIQLADIEAMAEKVIAFSDDGKGVQVDGLMLEAMQQAKSLGKTIVSHCEDERLIPVGGSIHDGEYAKRHGLAGIPSASEYLAVKRDLALVRETGCSYHICHISTEESVELLRAAKAEGLAVTGETAPHYLLLDESCLVDEGRFKMNPPLRGNKDRLALLAAIKEGVIDIIATDHAPHSAEEKSKGLSGSAFGIVGLETAFSLLYTELVLGRVIGLAELIHLMSLLPRRRFGLGKGIAVGEKADLAVFDLDSEYVINSKEFLSMGKATPFEGRKVYGECILTMQGGKIVWQRK